MTQDELILFERKSHNRMLAKLPRESLVSLALTWLDQIPQCLPHRIQLQQGLDRKDAEEVAAGTLDIIESIREIYRDFLKRKVGKREIVNRMVNFDWENGFIMSQVVDIEFQYIFDKSNAFTWTASKITFESKSSEETDRLPTFHVSSFRKILKRALDPLVDNHIHIAQHPTHALVMMRIQIHEPGYAVSKSPLPYSRRIYFCAFPSIPLHIFHTPFLSPYNKLLRQSIETSLSVPGFRVKLDATSLTAKSLIPLIYLRNTSRHSTATGGWTSYANNEVDESPLTSAIEIVERKLKKLENETAESREQRREKIVNARFGVSRMRDGTESHIGLENERALTRVEFLIEQQSRDNTLSQSFAPKFKVLLEGTHVHEGLRQLAVKEIINHESMPSWITGEVGVSSGVIVNGSYVGKFNNAFSK
ncbi:centromere protein Chl4/mis15/CENP-N [Lipomyces oligophaga]|uniref:centromere protein Chl4/mis15/CENP-N n=1 Tax=Lipomyces oligophaga TaxID=45792 RepID=UPI0034CE93C1